MDGRGFTETTWAAVPVFNGCCATPHDVDQSAAVFALGDTLNGRAMPDVDLPQPVIWYDDDDEFAAVAVQAEVHETEDGETMEVLGLVLPDGQTVISLLEDVDVVDATDPVWRALLAADLGDDGEEMNGSGEPWRSGDWNA